MADPIADIDAGTTKFGVWPSDGLIVTDRHYGNKN